MALEASSFIYNSGQWYKNRRSNESWISMYNKRSASYQRSYEIFDVYSLSNLLFYVLQSFT